MRVGVRAQNASAKCSKSRDLTAIAICGSNHESQITSNLRQWGEGMGPTTSAWSPPGNGPETDRRFFTAFVFAFVRVRLRLLLFFCSLCILYITMVSMCLRPAKRRAQNLQGISNFFRCCMLLLSWGRFPRRGRPCVSSVSRTLKTDP